MVLVLADPPLIEVSTMVVHTRIPGLGPPTSRYGGSPWGYKIPRRWHRFDISNHKGVYIAKQSESNGSRSDASLPGAIFKRRFLALAIPRCR